MGRNDWFEFKKFRIEQKETPMKVGTDGVLLGAWTPVENTFRILDVGTGTGLIALMLAQRCEAFIDAVEINEKAFREAGYNFSQSIWKERLRIFHEDFQNFSSNQDHQYDLVVTNPPFFVNSLKTSDRHLAVAKHDINLTYAQLISKSVKLLKSNGRLSLIVPFENLDTVRESARLAGFYLKTRLDVITKAGNSPIRVLLEFSLIPVFPEKEQIILKEETGEFSENFKKLTSSYYLNF